MLLTEIIIFQGSSPIFQVARIGGSDAWSHENRQQVSLLIPPLRQGSLNFHVSSVGGVKFKQAVTSRENKAGLYDWKFFNALGNFILIQMNFQFKSYIPH